MLMITKTLFPGRYIQGFRAIERLEMNCRILEKWACVLWRLGHEDAEW